MRRPTRTAFVCIVVSIVAVSGAALAASSIEVADPPHETADRVGRPESVVVIGDSAISAIRWVPGADNAVAGFSHTLDLESCRRLVAQSCSGREGRRPATAYNALAEHGRKYNTVVIATGYNDSSSNITSDFQSIVALARSLGYQQVVWYTLRSDVDYVSPGNLGYHRTFAQSNAAIREQLATGNYPDVVLADWAGYTADKPEWFATDGVHYRAAGAWAASDYLTRKMAFLDRRPCPAPRTVGAVPENPCPDPDVTGPVADVAALYPIGQDGVLCYEIGADRRVECRLDTHVIQLTRELSLGMSGNDVSSLQIRLQRLGYATAVSGSFGTATADAVRAFQTASGLPATGAADRQTLERLGFDVSGIR